MRKPKIIGLVGYAGTGKTTVAKALVESYKEDGLPAIHGQIKGPLIDACRALVPGLPQDLSTQEAKKALVRPGRASSVRDLMDAMGGLIDETLGSDWLMLRWLEDIKGDDKNLYVLDDVRTMGQARSLAEAGGILVFLRPRAGQPEDGQGTAPDNWVKDIRSRCWAEVDCNDTMQAVAQIRGIRHFLSSSDYIIKRFKALPVKKSPYHKG